MDEKMAGQIPDKLPKPRKLAEASEDLTREDYRWLVDRRSSALRVPKEAPPGEHYDSKLERIVGKKNFLPINFLGLGALRSRAVCRIEMSGEAGWRAWGTGFLIAPDVMMTNNHVFANVFQAKHARLLFNDELDLEENAAQPEIVLLDPDRLFITNAELDFSVCAVAGRPGDRYGFIEVNRDPHKIARHEHVNIVQHPQGRRKEVSLQENVVEFIKSRLLLYTTDTEPGSSGSPVLNNAWKLVALHHAGGDKDEETGAWKNNEGIRISSIVRYLESLAVQENHEGARKFLSFVTGANPYEGIFGLHGRRPSVPSEWPATERVVYDYQGTDAYLDVGFWNIEHFNRHSSAGRRQRVADLLEQLALDAIGLVEIEEPAVQGVVEELNSRGFEFGYLMQDTRGAQDMAIIYDKSTLTAEKEVWPQETFDSFSETVAGTGKMAWYRIPLLARLITTAERSVNGAPFDFLMCVLHAKATTHQDQPGIPEIVRSAAAEKLAAGLEERMGALQEHDVVVGGDFNARLEEQSFRPLQSVLSAVALTSGDAESGDPDAYTYLGSARGLIDHIYITPGANTYYDPGSISLTRIDRDIPHFVRDISDHAPVISRFTFRGTGAEPLPGAEGETYEVAVPATARRIILNRQDS